MTQRPLKFALFGNIYQAKKSASVQQVLDCLSRSGVDVLIDMEYYYFLKDTQRLSIPTVAKVFTGDDFEADFAVSMGGDGTFLKTAGRVREKGVPILGVNVGRLGFLADVSPTEIEPFMRAILDGDYTVDHRAVVQVEGLEQPGYALNDVAILKRDSASMISIRASIDGELLTTYQADGLIVSTPTGSTAYSLSNGGPIIVPGTNVLLMTAVAPHSLNIRPIVIPDSAVITLEVESRSHSFLVAVDGQSSSCHEGTTITLRRAPYTVKTVKRAGQKYFGTLREKMMWGADVR